MFHALLFEINAIHDYLFASGRLRDVAAASELLERLTSREAPDNLLDATARATGVTVVETTELPQGDGVVFTRRAGGAFYAFSERPEPLRRLRDLWTLVLQQATPHLSFSLGMGEGKDLPAAFDAARAALRADSQQPRPQLPAAAPVAERSRRTGQAGVEFDKRAKDGVLDDAIARRKPFADLSTGSFLDRFSPEKADLRWRDWPRNLEPEEDDRDGAFPFVGEARTVALLHADGNGLGLLLRRINEVVRESPERFVELYTQFSKLVADVTAEAARQATAEVLLPAREREGTPCLPARPILLGGDDILVLVRADLAMDYLQTFTRVFEVESAKQLDKLKGENDIKDLPERLTLGAGLVFLRASQPFHLAMRLAESLITEAKRAAKDIIQDNPPSAVAFYRVTSSLVEDYDDLLDLTLTHHHAGHTYRDTLGPYFLADQAPRLADLIELTELLGSEGMARGPTRQLLTLMGHAEGEAQQRYRRWRMRMREKRKSDFDAFESLFQRLTGSPLPEDLPYAPTQRENPATPLDERWKGDRVSPLGDAIALMGAGHVGQKKTAEEDAA